MKHIKNLILVFIFIIVGTAFIVVAECVIPLALDHNNNEQPSNVVGIEVICDNKYFVNQPLNTQGAKIKLEVKGEISAMKYIDLQQSNVSNFSTKQVGDFEMVVSYGSFSCTIPYSVSYKRVDIGDQIFDFEIGQALDLKKYKIYCYDYYDNIQKIDTFENATLTNLGVDKLVENEIATLEYQGFSTSFDYSVFHFSRNSNYSASQNAKSGECSYQLLSFVPNANATLKLAKKLDSFNLIEKAFEFELKRIDGVDYATFVADRAIAKLDYATKELIVYKGVVQNETDLVFDLQLGDEFFLKEPVIRQIAGVEGFGQTYLLNESVGLDSLKLNILMSDNTQVKVDIDKENVSNFSTEEVGTFNAKFSFYSFDYEQTYYVNYKAIKFYEERNSYKYELNSIAIFEEEIICFDANDMPVAIKTIGSQDVVLSGFDSRGVTGQMARKARVVCFGASLEFNYFIV